MKKIILILTILLTTTICFSQTTTPPPACIFEWCGALLPTTAGEKTTGKDNCGNYCSKHGIGIATPPTASTSTGTTVTLSTNEKGEPVLTAICPATSTFNEYDFKMHQLGYIRKAKKVAGKMFVYYDKP